MQSGGCLVWDLDPVMFKVWIFEPRWYGLCFGLGLVIAYFTTKWQFGRTEYDPETAVRLFLYVYLGTLVGAFLGHRIFYEWDSFIENPLATLSLKSGISGLSSHGAALGILISIYFFHKKYHIRFLEIFDRLSFGVSVVAAMVRIGNLMNSEIVGRKTDLPWAFCFPLYDSGRCIPRHPSQIYEAIMGCLVLASLILCDRLWRGEKRPLGFLTGLFAIHYFSLRFLVEFVKEHQALPASSPLTMGQYLSIPFVIAGVAVLLHSLKTRLPATLAVEPQKPLKKEKKKKR